MNNYLQIDKHIDFYNQTISHVDKLCGTSDELCFVYVQHAFLSLIPHMDCLGDRLAALIPKASSSMGNRDVVKQLEARFPGKIFGDVNRAQLRNQNFTLSLLKNVTRGRPFAILEYGGYFAPSAEAIANDPDLGPRLAGFVEGTENGIKGADDGLTIGYQNVVNKVSKPVVSKSRSRIKLIMDRDIGPAIVESCNNIVRRTCNIDIETSPISTGVVGLGSIGKGILRHLDERDIGPLVYDTDLAVMAELAHCQHFAVPLEILLARGDLVFLNTGSCFLAQQPELLEHLKEDAILVLCTSGDVEAGIPQLIAENQIQLIDSLKSGDIATYKTKSDKHFRVILGGDGVGQAPNLVVENGSESLANLMSDMEFYALGCYLGWHLESSAGQLPTGTISDSPNHIQDLILKQWLQVFHPHSQQSIMGSNSGRPEQKPQSKLVNDESKFAVEGLS